MKPLLLVGACALAVTTAVPAFAQTPAPAAPVAPPVEPAAGAKVSFASTKISDLIKDAKAKAILEKTLPPIVDYYDQIGDMTLTDVVPVSQDMLDEAKLKAMQAEYDKG